MQRGGESGVNRGHEGNNRRTKDTPQASLAAARESDLEPGGMSELS